MALNTKKQLDDDKLKNSADQPKAKEKAKEFAEKVEQKTIDTDVDKKTKITEALPESTIRNLKVMTHKHELDSTSQIKEDLKNDPLIKTCNDLKHKNTASYFNKVDARRKKYFNRLENMTSPDLAEITKIKMINKIYNDWFNREDFVDNQKYKEIEELENKIEKLQQSEEIQPSWTEKIKNYFSRKPTKQGLQTKIDDLYSETVGSWSYDLREPSIELIDKILESKIPGINQYSENINQELRNNKSFDDPILYRWFDENIKKLELDKLRKTMNSKDIYDLSHENKNLREEFLKNYRYFGLEGAKPEVKDEWLNKRNAILQVFNKSDASTLDKNIFTDISKNLDKKDKNAWFNQILQLHQPIGGEPVEQIDYMFREKNSPEQNNSFENYCRQIISEKGQIYFNQQISELGSRYKGSNYELKGFYNNLISRFAPEIISHKGAFDENNDLNDKTKKLVESDEFNRSFLKKNHFIENIFETHKQDSPVIKSMIAACDLSRSDIKLLMNNQNKLAIFRIFNQTDAIENLESLATIKDELDDKLANEVSKIFNYPPEIKDRIKRNIDNLEKEFDIVTNLASIYKKRGQNEQLYLLGNIFEKIAGGKRDFIDWKFSPQHTTKQLNLLDESSQKEWQKDKISTKELSKEDKSIIQTKINTLKTNLSLIEEDINEQLGDKGFKFTQAELAQLEKESQDVNRRLKESKGKDADARNKKTEINNKLVVLRFFEDIKNLKEADFDIKELKKSIKRTASMLNKMGVELNLFNNLNTIAESDIKKTSYFEAKETSDPYELLNVGVNPIESCQSWRKGGFNDCLLAYVADSNKKIVQVRDESNDLLARSVMKLVNSSEGDMVLFPEKIYTRQDETEIRMAMIKTFIKKADTTNTRLALSGAWLENIDRAVLDKTINDYGFQAQPTKLRFTLPQSVNGREYSDVLSGRQTNYEKEHEAENILLLEKKEDLNF